MIRVNTTSAWKGEQVKVRADRTVGKTAYEIGLIVEGYAKSLAPVLTGRLAGSVTTQAKGRGTDVEAPATGEDKIAAPGSDKEVLVGTAVDYGPYVEFGTARSNAQPFLRPALDLARGEAVTIAVQNGRLEFEGYSG